MKSFFFAFVIVLIFSTGAIAQSQSSGVPRKTGPLMDGTWSRSLQTASPVY